MVLVNSPGSDAVYAPFRHADWHGMTAADLIFPAFLVIMGVSADFSHRSARRAVFRAAALFALGLLANGFVSDAEAGLRRRPRRPPSFCSEIGCCSLWSRFPATAPEC